MSETLSIPMPVWRSVYQGSLSDPDFIEYLLMRFQKSHGYKGQVAGKDDYDVLTADNDRLVVFVYPDIISDKECVLYIIVDSDSSGADISVDVFPYAPDLSFWLRTEDDTVRGFESQMKRDNAHVCATCARNSDNRNDNVTRCPIEEHYALLKNGFCHLWEEIDNNS